MASVLYLVNNTTQLVSADGIVNLGSIKHRTCQSNANLIGNGITIFGQGYYTVDVSATFTATEAGIVTLSLYKDGVELSGASASETITLPNSETRSIAFTIETKEKCCESLSTLTLVNTGVEATFSNVTVRVKRDA